MNGKKQSSFLDTLRKEGDVQLDDVMKIGFAASGASSPAARARRRMRRIRHAHSGRKAQEVCIVASGDKSM
jgi:hypothetical protein